MNDIKPNNNIGINKEMPHPAVNGVFTSKDLATDQDIRWCPGCGDYSILKQMQKVLPEMGVKKEDIVFVSGIGCSSRFPYYMNTYGMHSIHGRATAIATGLKTGRPELNVWVVTGDGDALSIGGNHFIHILRRNPDINVLLFNNQIYGLTKGQFSPTSETGKLTKSSPMGSVEHPFNPLALSLGADATFVARSIDRDPKHLQEMIRRTALHKGTSLLEIYQNCNVFNDGAFLSWSEKASKADYSLMLEHGKPLIFGKNNEKGIRLEGLKPVIVDIANENISVNDLWIHDESDLTKAQILARFFDVPVAASEQTIFPRPFGVLYWKPKPCFEDGIHAQIKLARDKMGEGNLDELLKGSNTWEI